MFSVTMMAASTSRPTAMASPPSVMVLMPDARRLQQQARERERERQRQGDDERRAHVPQQQEEDATTSKAPISTARPTPPSAEPTSSDWS